MILLKVPVEAGMTANIPIPRPLVTMRTSACRYLLASLLALAIFITLLRQDTTAFSRGIIRQSALPNQNGVHDQHPMGEHAHHQLLQSATSTFNMSCKADMDHLKKLQERYHFGERFQYMKRYVRFNRTAGLQRKSMTHLDQRLIPEAARFSTIDFSQKEQTEAASVCAAPLELPVPASGFPSTVNASDFMFGVSTTYKRFMDKSTTPIKEWIFWLTDSYGTSNGGKLLLMLLDATDDQLQEVANLLGDVGIDADVYHSESQLEMAVRYLALVPTLYTHPDAASKKWLVTCDDDTFFPSMHGLIDKLAELDHTQEMYVGTLSEDVGAIHRHGSQAFGGAGVFLSLPMARKITELYDHCTTPAKIREANSGWGPQGDIILRKCIYANTDTRLTTLPDLWQLDILGHPSGFYESGIKPLSLHHYRGGGWHHARPGQMTKVAQTCGEDCTMLRFQTPDNFIISGYSIAHYPGGVDFNTRQMEGTMHAAPEDKGWNLDYKLGPQRPSLLRTGRKIAWDLHEAELKPDGSVVQTYIRWYKDERWVQSNGQPMSNIDGIIELVWVPA